LQKQFTRYNPSTIVAPGEQVSNIYMFLPDRNIELERPLVLAAQVYYRDELSNNYLSFFFNETIMIVEPEGTIDLPLYEREGERERERGRECAHVIRSSLTEQHRHFG
jgi:hypothetical protein